MGSRTYIPTFLALLAAVVKYIRRNQVKLTENLPENTQTLVDALLDAADALLNAIQIVEGD